MLTHENQKLGRRRDTRISFGKWFEFFSKSISNQSQFGSGLFFDAFTAERAMDYSGLEAGTRVQANWVTDSIAWNSGVLEIHDISLLPINLFDYLVKMDDFCLLWSFRTESSDYLRPKVCQKAVLDLRNRSKNFKIFRLVEHPRSLAVSVFHNFRTVTLGKFQDLHLDTIGLPLDCDENATGLPFGCHCSTPQCHCTAMQFNRLPLQWRCHTMTHCIIVPRHIQVLFSGENLRVCGARANGLDRAAQVFGWSLDSSEGHLGWDPRHLRGIQISERQTGWKQFRAMHSVLQAQSAWLAKYQYGHQPFVSMYAG